MNISCYGYVDIFPVHKALAGQKCLVISNFENHSEFSNFKGYLLTCEATSLVSDDTLEFEAWLTDLGTWVFGEKPVYGLILAKEVTIPKGFMFKVKLTKENRSGI